MSRENQKYSIGRFLGALVLAPLFLSLILWIWMWGVFSVGYLHNEIMQHPFSAHLYKTIESFFKTNFTINDPSFITTILTLAIIIALVGIVLISLTLVVKTFYKSMTALNTKKSSEDQEEEIK